MELIVEIMTIFVFRLSRQHLSPTDRFYCCHQPVLSIFEAIFRSLEVSEVNKKTSEVNKKRYIQTVLKADRLALPSAAFVTLKTVEVSKKERIPISTYRLLYRLY